MLTVLIDGKYFLYRSINARVDLSYGDLKTSMVYLLLNAIKSVTKKFSADNTIIMWDSRHSLRREIYPDYKRKNKTPDPILQKQFENINKEYRNIKNIMREIGFASYNRRGYEADDLIAQFCKIYKEDIIIASRDEDLFVLLSDKVKIYNPHTKEILTEKWFEKEYGIAPINWSYVKTIAGCKSDNVQGIKGVGLKTALKLIHEDFNPDKKDTPQILKDNKDLLVLNNRLVSLPFNNKIDLKPIRKTRLNIDKFINVCQTYGLKSFLDNLDEWKSLFIKENHE